MIKNEKTKDKGRKYKERRVKDEKDEKIKQWTAVF